MLVKGAPGCHWHERGCRPEPTWTWFPWRAQMECRGRSHSPDGENLNLTAHGRADGSSVSCSQTNDTHTCWQWPGHFYYFAEGHFPMVDSINKRGDCLNGASVFRAAVPSWVGANPCLPAYEYYGIFVYTWGRFQPSVNKMPVALGTKFSLANLSRFSTPVMHTVYLTCAINAIDVRRHVSIRQAINENPSKLHLQNSWPISFPAVAYLLLMEDTFTQGI